MPDDTKQVSKAALELFKFGQEEAAKRGLLLVDTKYEFGKAADGEIYLIDEVRDGYLRLK
jgi:phosphoribosylaminoimidazole-succinocarboxamide synthase